MANTNSLKNRQVYKRQDVLHITFAGGLYAPAADAASAFDHKDKVVAWSEVSGKRPPSITVASPPDADILANETWYPVTILSRKEKDELGEALNVVAYALKRLSQVEDDTELENGTNILDLAEDDDEEVEAVA